MFRRIQKAALSIGLVLVLCFSASIAGFAAQERGIAVKVGDRVTPLRTVTSEDGRLYASFRELFTELDAKVDFNPDSEMVTATKGSTSVEFGLDTYEMTVTDGALSQSVYIDATAYMDDVGAVYVPVRYAAQAFGYMVGWDGAAGAVVLTPLDSLLAQSSCTYTVIDRYLAAQKAFEAKSHSVSGSFDMKLGSQAGADIQITPLTASGTLSGVVKGNDAQLKLNMTSNASAFIAGIAGPDAMDENSQLALQYLEKMDLSLIVNSGAGMLYIQTPLLTALTGQDIGSWLSLDLSDMTGGTMNTLGSTISKASSFKELLDLTLRAMNLSDDGTNGSLAQTALAAVNATLSDQALVREGDNYVMTLGPEFLGSTSELSGSLKLTFKFKGANYDGLALDASVEMGYPGTLMFSYTADATNSGNFKLGLNIDSSVTFDMAATVKYTETSAQPASAPPAGSTVVSLEDILSSAMSGYMF